MHAVLVRLSEVVSGPTTGLGNGGTYICNGTGTHRHHSRRAKRLNNSQKYQRAIVGGNSSEEDVRADVDCDGNEIERPATLPICETRPK